MQEGKLRRLLSIAVLTMLASFAAQVHAGPAAEEQQRLAPTYRIFATREGLVGYTTANGHVIRPRDRFVALPSWTALSPKGTDKFSVRLTYKGRSVVAPVWDVGPWNTRDDYWNPNRRYSDLPVGLPMAQAARLDGYNGGRDERGRIIRDPNGIDIADGTFWDDLGMTRNDWVEVTFLWLGNDPGPGNAVAIAPGSYTGPEAGPPPQPVEVEPNAVTVDAGADGFSASGQPWYEAGCGLNAKQSWTYSTTDPAKATAVGTWTPALPGEGWYEVRAYIPACGPAATTSARYRIHHDGAVSERVIDQQASGGTWVSLGTYHFEGQTNDQPRVELADLTGDNGRAVRFDAVAWAPRQDTTPPDAKVVQIQRKDNGYLVTWGGSDDMTGLANYDVQVRLLPKGGWTDWKRGVTETSAWFGPDEGKQFAFRVRGKDWASNLEPWAEGADMDTTQAVP
jgi:hypothetical protein